jgi:hypothetical protein
MGYERNPRDRFREDESGSGREYGAERDRDDTGRFERGAGGYRRDGGRFDQRPYGGYAGRDTQSHYDREQPQQYGEYGRGRPGSSQGQFRGRGAPQGYDQDDRGFFARAGDEVRSWFGDEEAERRREFDGRYEDQHASHTDRHYGAGRSARSTATTRNIAARTRPSSRTSSDRGAPNARASVRCWKR